MELSKKDRLILFNQYEILKALNSEDEHSIKHYEEAQTILVDGYKHDYDYLLDGFSDDVPVEVCTFVWDVLQMYRSLNNSYHALSASDKGAIDKAELVFEGFDGNEECQEYMYCLFILEKMGRYEEIYDNGKHSFNTHYPIVDSYRRMLNTWQSSSAGRYSELTKDQILAIIQSSKLY